MKKLSTTIALIGTILASSATAGGFNNVSIPTDPKAQYEQQIIKDRWGVVSVKSHRIGPSGLTVTYIDFKCKSSKYKYTHNTGGRNRWTKTHHRSIKYFQLLKACDPVIRQAHKER